MYIYPPPAGTQAAVSPDTPLHVSQIQPPDFEPARGFLSALDASTSGFCFQTFDDLGRNRSLARTWHGTLDQLAPDLAALNHRGAGVFVTVNVVKDGMARTAENVIRVRSLFADFDRPVPLADAEETVANAGLPPPSIVVESSPGKWHFYWLTHDCPLNRFAEAQRALAAALGTDTSVCDLPRVMRMPGFLHKKGAPFRTRLVHVR